MSNSEIASGLKNAIERGVSLEVAAQSFVNAGYNPELVRAAASELSSGATTMTTPAPSTTEAPKPSVELTNAGESLAMRERRAMEQQKFWRKVAVVASIVVGAGIFLGIVGFLLYSFI